MATILDKLDVYQKASEAAERAERIARTIPPHHGDLQTQLRKAATSVAFNIAEGAYEFSAAEKARFYRIARRSCSELLAILDHIRRIGPGHPELGRVEELMNAVATMLTTMIMNRTKLSQ